MKRNFKSLVVSTVGVLLLVGGSILYVNTSAQAVEHKAPAHHSVDALIAAFKTSHDPLAAESLARLAKLTPTQIELMERALDNPSSPINQAAPVLANTNADGVARNDGFTSETHGAKTQHVHSAVGATATNAARPNAKAATIYDVTAYQTYDSKLFGVVITRFRVDLAYQTNGSVVTSVPANGCLQSYRNFNPGVAMSNAGVQFTKFGNTGRCIALWNGNIAISAYQANVQKRGTYWVNGCCGVYSWSLENV